MAVLGSGGFATVEEYLFIESTHGVRGVTVALVTVVGGGGSEHEEPM